MTHYKRLGASELPPQNRDFRTKSTASSHFFTDVPKAIAVSHNYQPFDNEVSYSLYHDALCCVRRFH